MKNQDEKKKSQQAPTSGERVLTLDDLANINGGDTNSIAPPPTEATKPSREVKL